MESDRITIRLGSLSEPLASACQESGRSPSEEVRTRLAQSLGVQTPKLVPGDVRNLGQHALPMAKRKKCKR